MLFLLLACTGKDDDSGVANDDTSVVTGDSGDSADTGDSGTDTSTQQEDVMGTFSLLDLLTGTPVEGAALTSGSETAVSDADGLATVPVEANGDHVVHITASGYRVHHIELTTDAADFGMTLHMASDAAVRGISALFGVTADPALGMLVVSVEEPDGSGGFDPIVGATVSLDTSYDLAIVSDPDGTSGYSEGNMLVEGGSTFVVFGNVTPGEVRITVQTPTSMACTTAPSETSLDVSANVFADEFTTIVYVCR
jgi:hypothetical protein